MEDGRKKRKRKKRSLKSRSEKVKLKGWPAELVAMATESECERAISRCDGVTGRAVSVFRTVLATLYCPMAGVAYCPCSSTTTLYSGEFSSVPPPSVHVARSISVGTLLLSLDCIQAPYRTGPYGAIPLVPRCGGGYAASG